MTTYERQQTILRLLEERSSLKVTDLAKTLEVSEGTIRNDLTALEKQSLLKRVRGGAIPKNGSPLVSITHNRAHIRAQEKRMIAKWAAELVSDGDVILLDASTTALHMATFLQDRRQLAIVTTQLETAQLLARDPQKTVILLGGVVKPDGSAVTGSISQDVLKDLHITTAFVSCVGFSFEAGLMEADIAEVEFKAQVVRSAANVVALIDSSKFGKVALKPFATLEQINHVVTDEGVEPSTLRALQAAHVTLTVCGETVQTLNPHDEKAKHYRIGFANLSEKIPFAIDVRRGLERAAKAYSNIDLIVADNDLNGEKALQVAEQFIEQDLDLIIEYQINEAVGHILMNRFKEKKIPVIAVDLPMVGATYYGADNYQSGLMAGQALGCWLTENWQGQLDKLVILEEKRVGPLPAARMQGQLHGLEQKIGVLSDKQKINLDSGNTLEQSYEQVLNTAKKLAKKTRLAVISFNDDAALGALKALRELGRDDNAAIVGQGADRLLRQELRSGTPAIIGSTAFRPEAYGETLLEIALQLLKGEPVPPAVYSQHAFIDQSNISDYDET